MIRIRARIVACVFAVLACQAASMSAAPVALCRGAFSVAGELDECCRNLAPGQSCPMHHQTHSSRERRTPAWRCMCSPADAMLASIVGVAGSLPAPIVIVYARAHVAAVVIRSSSTLERQRRPIPPPPRA